MAEDVTEEVAQEETPSVVETVAEADNPPAEAVTEAGSAPAEAVAEVEEEAPAVEESAEPSEPPEEEEALVAEAILVPGRDYELIFILDPNVDEGQTQAINERVRSIIEDDGGMLVNVRVTELRRLASLVKKRSEGFYVVMNIRSEPAPMSEVERVLKLEERVLRHDVLRLGKE